MTIKLSGNMKTIDLQPEPLPSACEGCDQSGILEVVECSGGAQGDVYFC